MDFLVQAFLRRLKNYRFFKIKCSRDDNGTVYIDLYDAPPEVDIKLINAYFEEEIGCPKIKLDRTKYGQLKKNSAQQLLNKRPNIVRHMCCIPMRDVDRNYLRISLDKCTYAAKMNIIDSILQNCLERRIKE